MTSITSDPLFLGLDLSTQQIKAVVISEDSSVEWEVAVHFDNDLPKYGTTSGAIRGPGEGEVTSPVAMWLDAIDLLLGRLKAAGVPFDRIASISGAGQQHGSVYWSSAAEELLCSLDPNQSLLAQLSPHAFAIQNAPIWQDSSTSQECQELENALGGAQALANLTGSRAYERFTASQIAKIRKERPEAYKSSAFISLVSSFIPSLFIGSIAPMEVSDASGMNLMDVSTCKWDERLLEACGGKELRAKLGPEPVPGGTVLGTVHAWWAQRWGFSPSCIVAPFTGDNPATVVALSTPGDAILSLGTSTTLLISIPPADAPPARFTTSHLLSHPTTEGAHIAMLCYKNGALAREHIRDTYADGDWARFNELVESTAPGCDGHLGLYFPLPEIIPPGVQGEFFFGDAGNTHLASLPQALHPRAILESQFLSIRARIQAVLPADAAPLHRLLLTGGASANPAIRQLAADLFGMKVFVAHGGQQGAGMGGAILAKYAWWRSHPERTQGSFEEMVAGQSGAMRMVAEPHQEVAKVYEGLVDIYARCEEEVVKKCAAARSATMNV